MNRPMQSPFNDILYTNTVPSDTECDSIRSLLAGPLKDLADITEEMRRLQSLIDEAVLKRERLQQFINAHLALLSPVRRLPDDIVRAVFTATLPSRRNLTMSADEGPLLLSKVCKSWRTHALTTPRLWASMHIVIPSRPKFEHLVALVNMWLERSGSVPLDISMVYSKTCDVIFDVSPLLSTLAIESRRWRSIHLMLPNFSAHSLEKLSSDDVPQLQFMGLCLPPPAQDDDITNPWPLAFLETNCLRSITFTGTHSFVDAAISWGTLTHLSIGETWASAPYLTCARALVILSQCTMLQNCKISLQDTDDGAPTPPFEHFSLRHLTDLAIFNHLMEGPGVGSLFFSRISLPNLRSFYLDRGYNVDITHLIPSPGSLERLCLDIEGLSCDNLLAALADMPLLQELVLSAEPRSREQTEETNIWRYWKSLEGDGEFLTHLTRRDDAALCPLLRRVDLHLALVSDESLLQFVQSRAALSSVTATVHRPVQLDIIPHLRDAIAGGLVVSLKYNNAVPEVFTYSPWEGNANPSVYMLPEFREVEFDF
ncbi:hypothetical protein B0H14DRAFT_2865017 [Mycena olivaceomarginata]|nr:hypothetical protein B0H14DRAFT_2865017 [Mycena olivaceomarginata]